MGIFLENKNLLKTKSKNENFSVSPSAAFINYSDMVFRLAFLRTKNKADAEDILSDVFLRLVKNSHKIMGEEHLKAWLIRTTLNRTNSLLKNPYRTRKTDTPLEFFQEDTRQNEILPIVLELSPKLKAVIYMYYYEGYSVNEIGKICSISVGTVKSRLSRARELLKSKLEGEFFDV